MVAVDIIVPVYNEQESIEELVKRIRAACPDGKITFVDNASTDTTVEIIRKIDSVALIQHDKNEGYGKSLRDGIDATRGEIVIFIDADLEYPPEGIPAMLKEFQNYDVVYGSRFYSDSDINMSAVRAAGNRWITWIFNFLYNKKTTDLYTGFRGFKRASLEGLRLQRTGFEFVLEISCKLAKSGARFKDIGIVYSPRATGNSKMKHIQETIKFVYWILYYRIFR